MENDFCQVGAEIPNSDHYCLGPGKLCPGGEYLGGSGANPKCHYEATWAGLILLAVLIVFTIFFDNLRHKIHKNMMKEYEGVVHAFFAELMELGFVSLIAFLIKRDWDGTGSLLNKIGLEVGLGKELHKMFEELHFLLFGLVVSFIVTNVAASPQNPMPHFALLDISRDSHISRNARSSHNIELFFLDFYLLSNQASLRRIAMLCQEDCGPLPPRLSALQHVSCPQVALLGAVIFRFRRFRKWSDQIEEGVEVKHVVPRLSKRPLRTGWCERRSKKDQQEVFIRLYYRFTDDLSSVQGDLHIPENFNLGHYLQINSAKIMQIVTDIDTQDWATMFVLSTIAFIGWLFSRGKSGDPDSTDVGYIVFWIYLVSLPVMVCILDWKLHNIVTKLIPVETDAYVPELPKTISRTSSIDVLENSADRPMPRASSLSDDHSRSVDVQSPTGTGNNLESASSLPRSETATPVEVPEKWVEQIRFDKSTEAEESEISDRPIQPAEINSTLVAASGPEEVRISMEGPGQHGWGDGGASDRATPGRVPVMIGGCAFGGPIPVRSDSISVAPEASNMAGGNEQASPALSHSSAMIKRRRSPFAFGEEDEDVEFQYDGCQEERWRIRRRFIPPYIRQDPVALRKRTKLQKWLGGKIINLHQNLFWFQARGPRVALRMLRYLILGSVVLLVTTLVTYREEMLCSGVKKADCKKTTVGGVFVLLLALCIPIFSTVMLSNSLTNFVLATSVEYMKMRDSIVTVIESSRKKRHLKLLRTLNAIAALIDQVSFLKALTDFPLDKTVSSAPSESGDRKSFVRRSFEMVSSKDLARAVSFDKERKAGNGLPTSSSSPDLTNLDALQAANDSRAERGDGGSGTGKIDAKDIRRSLEVVRKQHTRRSQEDITQQSHRHSIGVAPVEKHSLEEHRGKSGRNAKRRVKDISEDLENQWREIFMEADTDSNGVLDREEFGALLQATGNELDDDQVNSLFEVMDLNQSGNITFESFIEVMANEKHGHLDPEDLANQMWKLFDKLGTGRLGPEELKEGILKVKPNFNVEQAVELIHYIDVQRKGYIKRSQFVIFVTQLLHSEEF